MADWLSPQERAEFNVYNEKRYREQHGACIAQIEALKAEVDTARNAARDIAREAERLRDDLTACRLERDAAYRCLRGIASCSTCAVCRGAAMRALPQTDNT